LVISGACCPVVSAAVPVQRISSTLRVAGLLPAVRRNRVIRCLTAVFSPPETKGYIKIKQYLFLISEYIRISRLFSPFFPLPLPFASY
jgi:hypothetical protein